MDFHSKEDNGNLSFSCRAILLKFDTLCLLENYVKSVYYNSFPLTLYFQQQFIKVFYPANAKNAIKYGLKTGAIVSKTGERIVRQKQYHDDPETKIHIIYIEKYI